MISPFAFYYYSVYSRPLNWLQQSALTSWLTLHILPHFTYTESVLSNALILISWPLILSGMLLFLVGFAQIYWAKFTRRGQVAVGLYRYIRHPQYVALAILGLGTTIYWSRFIVLLAYVSMLFVYAFLARHEETVCLAKYGDSYRRYLEQTGMFLPKRWLGWLPDVGSWLPSGGPRRSMALLGAYVLLAATTVAGGWWLKERVLGQISVSVSDGLTAIALAPIPGETLADLQELLSRDSEVRVERDRLGLSRALGYVAPASWAVPELGLVQRGEHQHAGWAELLHPTIHGNSLDFDERRWTILIMEPVMTDDSATVMGRALVRRTLGYVPKLRVQVDLGAGEVVSVSDEPYESGWKGIPVPVY